MGAMGMMAEVTCEWCGRTFLRKRSQMKTHNYCSKACLGKANGKRLARKHMKICSNCGREFDYSGRHGARNKNFFCSYECYIQFKTTKSPVHCDWCGKQFLKKKSDIERTKHNFCSHECETFFRRKEGENSLNHRVNGTVVYRQIAEQSLGRRLLPSEEVHHIDGNHRNNSPENLMVLSSSEHSKIHASGKERDKHGRFIKKS